MDDETCDEFVQRWVRLFRQQVRDRGPRVTWAGMARSPMRLPRRPADSPASPLQHIHIHRVPINNCFSIPKREKKKKERERKKKYDRSYARSIVRTSYRRTGENIKSTLAAAVRAIRLDSRSSQSLYSFWRGPAHYPPSFALLAHSAVVYRCSRYSTAQV